METRIELPDNFEMAKKRLESTEKRLEKDPVVKEAYESTIEGYIEKGYVKTVDESAKVEKRWLLSHFSGCQNEQGNNESTISV